MSRLTELKNKTEVEQRIAAKLASGRFTNTDVVYSAEQAVKDCDNSSLRMTATVNGNKLEWK